MITKALSSKPLWYAAGVAVFALAFITNRADARNRMEVGQPMPEFTMNDVAGASHSLADHEGSIVVLSFCSKGCPYSRGTDPGLSEIAKKYAEKGVVFYGIDADRGNTPEDIAAYAKENGIPYPILKDEKNVYADAVGAARTPELFIVDTKGVLAYHGAFDNRTVPTQSGDVNYVSDALDELLAGKEVSTPSVSAWGCGIQRVHTS